MSMNYVVCFADCSYAPCYWDLSCLSNCYLDCVLKDKALHCLTKDLHLPLDLRPSFPTIKAPNFPTSRPSLSYYLSTLTATAILPNMAIIDGCPGIVVTVEVAGQDLPEYIDADEARSWTVSNAYVEALSNA